MIMFSKLKYMGEILYGVKLFVNFINFFIVSEELMYNGFMCLCEKFCILN